MTPNGRPGLKGKKIDATEIQSMRWPRISIIVNG